MFYTNDVVVPGCEFSLSLVGFNDARRKLFASLCNLSKTRKWRYHIDMSEQLGNADIVLIDSDDNSALDKWLRTRPNIPGKPCIYIGNNDVESARYSLRRTQLSGQLLKLLDNISVTELTGRQKINNDDTRVIQSGQQVNGGETSSPKTSAGRVLIVDDSLLVRKSMELCMQAMNITLDCAEDAETGILMAQNKRYDIIFMDIMLPEMDGYQACKLIKSEKTTRKVPVVMMTSKTSPFNKVKGVIVGCDQYLTKPVDASDLRDVIAKYILLGRAGQHRLM